MVADESSFRRVAKWGSASLFLVNTILLLTYHAASARPDRESPLSKDDAASLGPLDKILFGAVVLMAFELLDFCTKSSGKWLNSKLIPVRGKHLDELRSIDILFIGISKANTSPFTYFYLRFCWNAGDGSILWDLRQMSLVNTLLPLPLLFVLFDATYCLLHWILHWQSLYGFIHKHHHVQKAPSRANVDAVNVHPIEFVLGEYNHLLMLWFCVDILMVKIHIAAAVLFLAIGGALAGINHTRFDIVIRLPGTNLTLYDSKAHDVHHRIPNSNYGQYTMLWDHLFRSYRPYNPKDRVVAEAQLDPTTGKTVAKNTQ